MASIYILLPVLHLSGKHSIIFNTFPFLFSNKLLVIRTGVHKMPVRIAIGDKKKLFFLNISRTNSKNQ